MLLWGVFTCRNSPFPFLTFLCHAAFRVLSCSCGDSSAPIVHHFHQFDPLCHVAFRVFACSCGDSSAPIVHQFHQFKPFVSCCIQSFLMLLWGSFSPHVHHVHQFKTLCHVAFRVLSCSCGEAEGAPPQAPQRHLLHSQLRHLADCLVRACRCPSPPPSLPPINKAAVLSYSWLSHSWLSYSWLSCS